MMSGKTIFDAAGAPSGLYLEGILVHMSDYDKKIVRSSPILRTGMQ